MKDATCDFSVSEIEHTQEFFDKENVSYLGIGVMVICMSLDK